MSRVFPRAMVNAASNSLLWVTAEHGLSEDIYILEMWKKRGNKRKNEKFLLGEVVVKFTLKKKLILPVFYN